jgi:hypothetical protein
MFILLYIPETLVWVATINRGVPFGVQMAWLSNNNTGIPFDRMRVAPVTHWAVTHGTGLPETLKGQPATVYGDDWVTMGWPLTVTRGFVTVGCACPAWAH